MIRKQGVSQKWKTETRLTYGKLGFLLQKVADKTVYTMVQKRELPAFKVRGQRRFVHVDIDQWIKQQKTALSDKRRR